MSITKLYAGVEGDPLNSAGTQIRDTVNQLIETHVNSLKTLPTAVNAQTDAVYNVIGFYEGTTVGGGRFSWEPATNKASHNGVTVYAPEALQEWAGTQADIATLLNWAGVGSGCFVRLRSGNTTCPEECGAVASNPDFAVNDTLSLQKMLDFVTSDEKVAYTIFLNRLYAVNELKVGGRFKRGVRFVGRSGVDFKRSLMLTGFAPFQNNQTCVIKYGEDEGVGDSEGNYLENVSFFGRDFNFTKGMVWASRLSQGYAQNCSFRRATGPLWFCQKLEDWDFINCNFGVCGGNDNRPAFCLGDPPILGGALASVGNNAIRFLGGRFEFIDGPHMGTVGANAWASTVTIIGTKFETGTIPILPEDPYPNPSYGSFSPNYFVFQFLEGIPNRITVRVSAGTCFSGVSVNNCKGIVKMDRGDEFSCMAALMSGDFNRAVNLFELESTSGGSAEIYNFVFKNNTHRTFGADELGAGVDFTFKNKNTKVVDFEYPFSGNISGNIITLTTTRSKWYASEIAVNAPVTRSKLVQNPDNATDPCESIAKTVLTVTDNSFFNILFRLNQVGLDGQLKGYQFKSDRNIIRVRAKISGVPTDPRGYGIGLRDDTGELTTLYVNTTSLDWAEKYFSVPEGRGQGLRVNNVADNAGVSVFIDSIEIVPIYLDYSDYLFSLTVPATAAGVTTRVSFTTPVPLLGKLFLWNVVSATGSLNNAEMSVSPQVSTDAKFIIRNLNSSENYDEQTIDIRMRIFD